VLGPEIEGRRIANVASTFDRGADDCTEKRPMHVMLRAGDMWEETTVPESDVHATTLLAGLEVAPAELLVSAHDE
jgi:hypothetical protein